MKKSYNKAFTLVELLAVIVILAIVLVIAVPKIMDVINSSKKSTLETSVKMIASAAEKTKMQNIVLGKEDEDITCSSVAKLNSDDYDLDNCTITFDTNNNASVNINGKGKFSGLSVCGGTKTQATAQTEMCATDGKYFSYEKIIEVEDVNKCTAYLNVLFPNTEDCPTCEEENAQICNGEEDSYGYTITDLVKDGTIPSADFEEAGIALSNTNILITGYNTEGGLDVVIPITIDGYTVTGISDGAFVGDEFYESLRLKSVVIPNTVTNIGRDAFILNNITSITIPSSVTSIGESAFYGNPLSKVYLENLNIKIVNCAFGINVNQIEGNLPDTYRCIVI